jgi:hypothetical protein
MIAVTVDAIFLSRFLSLSFDEDDHHQTPQKLPLTGVGVSSSPALSHSPLRGGFTGPLTKVRCELTVVEEKCLFDANLLINDESSPSFSRSSPTATTTTSPSATSSHSSSLLPRPVAGRRTNTSTSSSANPSPWKSNTQAGSPSPLSELFFKPVSESAATTIYRAPPVPNSPGSTTPSSNIDHDNSVTIQISVFLLNEQNQPETMLLATATETHSLKDLPDLQPCIRNPRALCLLNRSGERVGEVHCFLSFQMVKAIAMTSSPNSHIAVSLSNANQESTLSESKSILAQDANELRRAPSPLATLMTSTSSAQLGQDIVYPPTPQR